MRTIESFPSSEGYMYGVFMHSLRSFIITSPERQSRGKRAVRAGLKCQREFIQFKGFYSADTLSLAERRYSTALCLFPLARPCGHFTLVSVADTKNDSLTEDVWFNGMARDARCDPLVPARKKYPIKSAGLYSGMSMFQLQICAFIDSWEKDWSKTIAAVDRMISVEV